MRLSIVFALLPVVLGAPAVELGDSVAQVEQRDASPGIDAAQVVEKRESPAPLIEARANGIVGKYIVKFKEGTAAAALEKAIAMLSSKPDARYSSIFQGFTASLDESLIKVLRNHPLASIPPPIIVRLYLKRAMNMLSLHEPFANLCHRLTTLLRTAPSVWKVLRRMPHTALAALATASVVATLTDSMTLSVRALACMSLTVVWMHRTPSLKAALHS